MTDNAATARALRADEYESRFLSSVEPLSDDRPHRRESRPRAYGTRQDSSAPVRSTANAGVPGRRTIQITGQVAAPRRRPSTTATALVARPDRTAMWAFVLALFLVLMAVATAHAAV
jgi:hypothetical protein